MTVPSHAMPSAAALRVEAVVKTLSGRRVLDGVGLEISRGQVYGLVGPNGAGKTTLLRCIVGFSRPEHGRILVEGRDVGRRPAAARERVGALIDRPGFYPFLTGAENLRELMLARGQRPDATVVREALRRVGLLDDGARRFRTYSKGMGQRLALAAALLFRPPVVVLDEPTDGLDPQGIRDVRNLVRRMRDDGHAILLCTHDLHQVQSVADTIGVMHRGRLLTESAPAELVTSGRVEPPADRDGGLEDAVLDLLARADHESGAS